MIFLLCCIHAYSSHFCNGLIVKCVRNVPVYILECYINKDYQHCHPYYECAND